MKKLICKITNKEFGDLENRSGVITEHLRTISVQVPTSFLRRKYLKENGISWHMQFFNIIEVEEKEVFKCKYCEWKTYDLDNKSGGYTSHLKEIHSKIIQEYINEFPEERWKFKTFYEIKKQREETLLENNFVDCQICGEKLRYLTNTHLSKHNITPGEYKIKYGLKNYVSINFKNKTKDILAEAAKHIKNSFVSKPEKDLREFITELGLSVDFNNKSLCNGVEIDIIIPDKKICFEFNGNLYHSEVYGKKTRQFHIHKTNLCQNKGYKLIHIMEDEWFLKNEIVKEKIKNILGKGDKQSIFARKCIIKTVETKEKNDFLNKNHIQGEDKSNVHLGAFFEGKLVSVCTFSSSRKMVGTSTDEYELKRFASDINYNVVGIFSKFISFFKKNYQFNKIFTFLDIRWNSDEINNVYIKNGFVLENQLGPDYTYYNSKVSRYKRFHKFSFGKSSLKKKFPEIYSDNKTEWEIMKEAGYDRIWDCGKYKYSIINDSDIKTSYNSQL